jgi:PEP-CTERM motif
MKQLLSFAFLFFAFPATYAGPTSSYYMTTGTKVDVVLGNSLVNNWATNQGSEFPIAVQNGLVSTSGSQSPSLGSLYNTAGTFQGTNFAYPGTISQFFDGTTDGTSNYGVDFTNGKVYRMGLNWSAPTLLFTVGTGVSGVAMGITYDSSDNSLWISGFTAGPNNGAHITHFDLLGNVLGGFDTVVASMTGLALDPADGTLWFGTQTDLSNAQRQLFQYSTNGTRMDGGVVFINGLTGDNFLGGEFEFTATAIPEPSSLLLLAAGVMGAAANVVRRRRQQAAA